MSMSSKYNQKDKNDRKMFSIKQKCPYKFGKKKIKRRRKKERKKWVNV
jgi:hypothetical protein